MGNWLPRRWKKTPCWETDSGSGEDEAEFLTASNHRDREGNGNGLKVGGGAGIIRRNSSQDTAGGADLV